MKSFSRLLFLLLWCYGIRGDPSEETTNATVPKPTILHFHVHTDVRMRFARTVINTKVVNRANISQEVGFSAILPESAFISEFQMLIDDQIYNAYVKEKEAARQEYEEAVSQGRTAAHVTMSARDSKRFDVSLNVEPEKKVTFILTYEELLNRKLGVYKHVLNLDPGQIVADFKVVVRIKETNNITKLHVPALFTNNEILENPEESSNHLAVIERPNEQTAVVKFKPTPDEQRALATEGIKGQFVVEYDVDRSQSGEVLMQDGYFVHFFAPEDLPPLRKHVTFVLDVSGSMSGRKIEQLQQAMESILDELNQNDLFSIVVFSSNVQVWDYNLTTRFLEERLQRLQGMRWGDYDEAPEEIDRLNLHVVASATPENVTGAKEFINMLTPVGGTNINDAVLKGLELSKLAISRYNVSTAESNDFQQNQEQQQQETDQKPEPILIFLTDGQANVGERNLNAIMNNAGRANTGNCPIYTLALGSASDFEFLKKLSLRNSGFARKIYEASDTALQLRNFYRQIASPLMTQVTFKYQPEQVFKDTLTKLKFRIYSSGSELAVAGKLKHENFSSEVQGIAKSGNSTYQYNPLALTTNITNTTAGFMERLWAYLNIQQLLEKEDANITEEDTDSSPSEETDEGQNNQTALDLALRYSFVTPLTSLVVVKPNETNSIDTVDASDSGVRPLPGLRRISPARSNIPGSISLRDNVPDTNTRRVAFASAHRNQQQLANLNEVTWLAAVTNNSTVTLQTGANGTAELLQLAEENQANVAHATCRTPGDHPGHCRHFRHCILRTFTTNQQDFLPYFCRIENFVGVCCPDSLQPVVS